ncbi:hypothetical protein Cgig2_025376 [Carnegiea gigantea]|uniref:MBD domain-containing protein n=1 Tax=Carnegiea gigantea TaxID=171969 RepID=A0A9Q1JMH3_9CARY|nr:hypothetical protein Cgig2_025376 [Carnegiea gigantea]
MRIQGPWIMSLVAMMILCSPFLSFSRPIGETEQVQGRLKRDLLVHSQNQRHVNDATSRSKELNESKYYIDPTNGYIFRSLKDIDRYLLTGKLGRHVTKTKPKDLDNSVVRLDMKPVPLKQDVSKKKKVLKSSGTKKACLAAPGQKSAGNSSEKSPAKASKKEDVGLENSAETAKKKISRPSKGTTSKSSRKREANPFFILDPDQCEQGSAASIPNLSEIIDSVQKEREGHNTVYISAPAIGALLGGQLQETSAAQHNYNYKQKPQFSLTICRDYAPNFPTFLSTFHVNNEALESNIIIDPNLDPSLDQDKSSEMVDTESKDREELGIPPVFGDLLTDPCIDFAIKTLTGAIPFGNESAPEDCYLHQQVGSSMVMTEGNSCQN